MNRLMTASPCFGAFAVLISCVAVSQAMGSHPDVLRHYRFIPRYSTLEVSGGFAGVEQTYHARGTFDLATGFRDGVVCLAIGCPPSTHIPYAKFEKVDAWLIPKGPLPYLLDLDQTLNLSGLDGTFRPTSPNQFTFTGRDGQGQPFYLKAEQRGRLLHLYGESSPECCDFFQYKFDALAYLKPYIDVNFDGAVDAADYVSMRKLSSGTVAPTSGGGGSEAGDYNEWLASFGENIDFSQFTADGGGAFAVPEPASLMTLAIGMAFLCIGIRRGRG